MSDAPQLVLDFGHRPALGREDFLVTASNAEAVAWIDAWPDWPGPLLVVYGPPGSGKSHLGAVWRERAGAAEALVGGDEAWTQLLAARACLIDDADAFPDDVAFFHLVNQISERRGHALVLAASPPARWEGRLADLLSRLRAAPTVAIRAPDDALIGAVLLKLFTDRQLTVGAEVISYLVTHMERSFDAARDIVAAADRYALAAGRAVTVPLVREVLQARLRAD
jgi:chromosomal replication initiation ATPase DnaA